MELLEADQNGWQLERYYTTMHDVVFTHFILSNSNISSSSSSHRDVWIRFHGSSPLVLHEESGAHREVMKTLASGMSWVLESGAVDTLYCFVTTETTAYGGYFHDLCQDEMVGLNVDYPLGCWGYALVGGEQMKRHLRRLRGRGYVPGVSHVTSVGFSDGGYVSSMNALLGLADNAVAWGGWVFASFHEWKSQLPVDETGRCSLRGMRLDVFISAGDAFYNGTSGWEHMGAPDTADSMRGGLHAIATFLDLVASPAEQVSIGGAPFERVVYSNAADDNAIACHVDMDSAHNHTWLNNQDPVLRATARLRRDRAVKRHVRRLR